MNLRIRRHIAMISLLLLALVMGGRAASLYMTCSCAHHHHTQCTCHEHKAHVETKCMHGEVHDADVEAVVLLESRFKGSNAEAMLGVIYTPRLCDVIVVSHYCQWSYALYDRATGAIKSLRAPPVLS